MKRLIALILCIVMCIPLFVACDFDEPKETAASSTPTTTGPVTTEDETTKESVYKDIARNDWGGYQFKIYYMGGSGSIIGKDFVCENPNGDVLNDQVYQRNTMVETDFNIDIYVDLYNDASDCEALLQAQFMSGWTEGDYNMVAGYGRKALSLSLKGYMADLGAYDEINLYREYWEQGYVEELMIDDSIYALIGDISVTSQIQPQALCFNKNLFKQEGLEEPYDLVRTYEWTVDKLLEYMDGFAMDYDNNGYDWEVDRFAISGWGTECSYCLFYSSGFKY